MQSYIDKLKAEAAAQQTRHEQSKLNKLRSENRVVCEKALITQIEELMRSLPPPPSGSVAGR